MNPDITTLLADMLLAMKNEVKKDWKEVQSTAKDFLERRKARLEMVIDFRVKGEITQEEFESRMSDEKSIMESELLAMKVISKAVAQKAANAAIEVLEKAVKAAISAAL